MRRKDREIINKEQIWRIMQRCGVCRVAFHDAEYPYIVPLNFGIGKGEPLTLYFHCAAQGKKLDLMQRDRRVSFEMDCAHQLVTVILPAIPPWSMRAYAETACWKPALGRRRSGALPA